MTVQELREKLELIDDECEVLIIDSHYNALGVDKAHLDVYFENEVDNNKTPFCIRTN